MDALERLQQPHRCALDHRRGGELHPGELDNTWFAALGATYKVTDRLSLRNGVAYDQSPVQDRFRTARIPDQDRYWLAAGLGYEIAPGVGVDLGYTHIFVDNGTISSAFPVPLAGTATGTLTGSYQNHIDIVSLAAKLRF